MTIAILAALALAAAEAATPAPPETVAVTATTAADGTQVLVHEVVVDAPAADVWEAVSTAQGWTTWAVPIAWQQGEFLETAYSATARPGDPTTIRQQILGREPGRRLVFRTVKAPEGFPHFDAYREVVSTIDLEPLGAARTRVRLTSAGYPDSEAGRELVGFFREGNRSTLEQLRERFVSGPIDWSRR
jgi:uncharacterized protein YndB with AHSA1/START domain